MVRINLPAWGGRGSCHAVYLSGSGYPEGSLFPWVVSGYSLIDAIESGIVKVPRVPVADDSMLGEQPKHRDLWNNIRDQLPKKGRKTENSPLVGVSNILKLDELQVRRPQEVAFKLAKLTLEKYFRGDVSSTVKNADQVKGQSHRWNNEVQAWRFPKLLDIANH